jgi:hypothetical protein
MGGTAFVKVAVASARVHRAIRGAEVVRIGVGMLVAMGKAVRLRLHVFAVPAVGVVLPLVPSTLGNGPSGIQGNDVVRVRGVHIRVFENRPHASIAKPLVAFDNAVKCCPQRTARGTGGWGIVGLEGYLGRVCGDAVLSLGLRSTHEGQEHEQQEDARPASHSPFLFIR